MIGIPIGLLYANAGEWLVHKYVLHGLARKKDSFWRFHWNEHHRASRKNGFHDPDYERSLFAWNAQGKEALALGLTAVAHAPLLPVAPFFTGTVIWRMWRYYRVHKRAHLDPDWARANLPWHWDHHMGPNQHANWCVTHPFFDHVMGTREPYLGTERERRDRARREARARGHEQAAPSTQPPPLTT